MRSPISSRTKSQYQAHGHPDRKSTRLNSSHDQISYAVFCLKKKNSQVELLWLDKSTRRDPTLAAMCYLVFCSHKEWRTFEEFLRSENEWQILLDNRNYTAPM